MTVWLVASPLECGKSTGGLSQRRIGVRDNESTPARVEGDARVSPFRFRLWYKDVIMSTSSECSEGLPHV